MSKDNVRQMINKIEKNPEFQKKYEELILKCKNAAGEVNADKIVEFGKTAGLEFTKDEFKEVINELQNQKSGELSEAELANVAGGCVNVVNFSSCFNGTVILR
ncbi:MAG: Nif11-like leader peptide family natural product precursor [Candidatus Wallbacteria bacterium]